MRLRFDRDSYRPKVPGIVWSPIVADDGKVLGEVGRYELAGALYAIGFGGARAKPDWHFRFQSEARREAKAAEYAASLIGSANAKAERKAKAKAFVPSLAVGDVLVSSWGYEQTNVDWYEVVEVVGKVSVKIRPIAASYVEDGFLCGRSKPKPGEYVGDAVLKRVGQNNVISINSYQRASPAPYSLRADGSREYASHYESHYA